MYTPDPGDAPSERVQERNRGGIARLGEAALRRAADDDALRCERILEDVLAAAGDDDAVILAVRVE